jgi:hypothetical protein
MGTALLWMTAALTGAVAGAAIAGFVMGVVAALMRFAPRPVSGTDSVREACTRAWRRSSRTCCRTRLRPNPSRGARRRHGSGGRIPSRCIATNANTFGRQLGMDARSRDPHGRHGSARSARHRSLSATTAAASAMRSSRWRRHPAAGTWWRSDSLPGHRSRTGTPWRDHVRLPSEPGCCL